MGSSNSKTPLSDSDISKYVSTTTFNSSEIRALWMHFCVISGDEETLTGSQFQAAMLFQDSALLDRLFKAFDTDDDDLISFSEYVECLSSVSNKATHEDKLKLSFKIYDFDGDGKIGVDDLTSLIAATLRENDIVISRLEIDQIVENTVRDTVEPGFLSFDEYKGRVHPHLLSHLTLNIPSIISKYSTATNISFASPRRP